jgi:hypothetical protein
MDTHKHTSFYPKFEHLDIVLQMDSRSKMMLIIWREKDEKDLTIN